MSTFNEPRAEELPARQQANWRQTHTGENVAREAKEAPAARQVVEAVDRCKQDEQFLVEMQAQKAPEEIAAQHRPSQVTRGQVRLEWESNRKRAREILAATGVDQLRVEDLAKLLQGIWKRHELELWQEVVEYAVKEWLPSGCRLLGTDFVVTADPCEVLSVAISYPSRHVAADTNDSLMKILVQYINADYDIDVEQSQSEDGNGKSDGNWKSYLCANRYFNTDDRPTDSMSLELKPEVSIYYREAQRQYIAEVDGSVFCCTATLAQTFRYLVTSFQLAEARWHLDASLTQAVSITDRRFEKEVAK